MSQIFRAANSSETLTVTGRHHKPCTDELLVSVHYSIGQQRSVVLSRPKVRELHAVLGRWLDDGWPGVKHTDERQVGAA